MLYEAGDIVGFVVIFQDYDGNGAVPSDYASSKIKLARYAISAGTVTAITTGITITTLAGWSGVYFCKYTTPSSGDYLFLIRGETSDTSIAAQQVFTTFESGRAWLEGLSDLDVSSVTVVTAVNGDEVSTYNHATMRFQLTGLGDISAYDRIDFAVKGKTEDADTAALIYINGTTGLTYINGEAATTAANGSVTVDDATAGDITFVVSEIEMAKLSTIKGIHYGVKGVKVNDTDPIVEGTFNILGITPRATT